MAAAAAARTAKPKTNAAGSHRSNVRNPAQVSGRTLLISNGRKTSHHKRRRNPAQGFVTPKTNPTKIRRRHYRRNPSEIFSSILFAIVGAVFISGFDWLSDRYLPVLSTPVRIGTKVAAGWSVGKFGSKYLGSYAKIAQNALYLAAGIDIVKTYLLPQVTGILNTATNSISGLLGIGGQPAAVVATAPVQNAAGQMGTRMKLANGNTVDVFGGTSGQMGSRQLTRNARPMPAGYPRRAYA